MRWIKYLLFVIATPPALANERFFDLIATGGAYVDYVATVPAETVRRHGIALDGARLLTDSEMRALFAEFDRPVVLPGGMAPNTVANLTALGGRAGFIGKVAADDAGDIFRRDFAERGVIWFGDSVARSRGAVTASAYVMVTGDQRSVAFNLGCSQMLTDADFVPVGFAGAAAFYVESGQLVSDPLAAVLVRAIERARGLTPIVINLQSFEGFDEPTRARVAPLIRRYGDVLIGNAREHLALQRSVAPAPEQVLVETRGAGGVLLRAPGWLVWLPAQTPDKIVSSVGAGDAFAAGYLLGRARGLGYPESLHRGVEAATAVLGEVGGRLPVTY